ncbi:MAG: L-threonylcarbamoyladenylate synthase [Gammaproteobacteria bacterium]|nr:MAG: L-threonylcarbamoyladenylate synthase [Gammaproteobacteria bacterium]
MITHTLLDTAGAVEHLRAGHIIAYPTEAVFGLGCDPRNESAVRKLLSLKGRRESAGFVLIASEFSQLQPWIADTEEPLIDRAMQTWPGPVTWLFPRAPDVPDFVAGEHDTVAVRITAHAPCRALCNAFGSALISSSANHASAKPARSAGEVEDYFGHYLGGILTGPLGGAEHPSEIRHLASGKVLRGALTG